MATLREWLKENEFDFVNGKIAYQKISGDCSDSPGWGSVDKDNPISVIQNNDPILDLEFDSGFGGPECPRFIAQDANGIYFPAQYDGSTWIEVVHNLDWYLKNPEVETPYPGG